MHFSWCDFWCDLVCQKVVISQLNRIQWQKFDWIIVVALASGAATVGSYNNFIFFSFDSAVLIKSDALCISIFRRNDEYYHRYQTNQIIIYFLYE